MMKQFRNNGAVGALLDEYEKAVAELITTIHELSPEKLIAIVDEKTNDADCRSIQTILTHVISAGYGYVIEIRKSLGEKIDFIDRKNYTTIGQYQTALLGMFKYNEQLFADYPIVEIEENDPKKKIMVSWGQHYDIEQLFEHAIVHILRHRRQIEKFIQKLN